MFSLRNKKNINTLQLEKKYLIRSYGMTSSFASVRYHRAFDYSAVSSCSVSGQQSSWSDCLIYRLIWAFTDNIGLNNTILCDAVSWATVAVVLCFHHTMLNENHAVKKKKKKITLSPYIGFYMGKCLRTKNNGKNLHIRTCTFGSWPALFHVCCLLCSNMS